MKKYYSILIIAMLLAGAIRAQSDCGQCLPLPYQFSYDSTSTGLSFGPGDLVTAGLNLCASVGKDIDAFSYTENACCFALPDTTLILYSVDRNTRGLPGLPVRQQAECNGVAGDVFGVVVTGTFPNYNVIAPCILICDAPHLDLNQTGLLEPESDLDALDVDIAGSGCPPNRDYVFSEWGSSDLTVVANGVSISFSGPSLVAGDDIDALNLESEDCISFSLSPGSPTLSAAGFHPGDLLCASQSGPPLLFLNHLFPLCLCPWGTPDCPTDNLDAVWFVDPGKDLGLVLVDQWHPIKIVEGFDTVHVPEYKPILWANVLHDSSALSEATPILVEVDTFSLLVRPGQSASVPGFKVGEYSFNVYNALDPHDHATGIIIVDKVVSVPDVPINNLMLHQNAPNPFQYSTNLFFELKNSAKVSINIYDMQGRLVKNLLNESLPGGEHIISWDGENERNTKVAKGVYLCLVATGNQTGTIKMILL